LSDLVVSGQSKTVHAEKVKKRKREIDFLIGKMEGTKERVFGHRNKANKACRTSE